MYSSHDSLLCPLSIFTKERRVRASCPVARHVTLELALNNARGAAHDGAEPFEQRADAVFEPSACRRGRGSDSLDLEYLIKRRSVRLVRRVRDGSQCRALVSHALCVWRPGAIQIEIEFELA